MTLAVEIAQSNVVKRTRGNSEVFDDTIQEPATDLVNLPAEATLDASIYPAATRHAGRSRFRYHTARYAPRRVMLTGGTGYLGAFILYELTVRRNLPAFALVRAENADAGLARLVNVMKKYKLIDDSIAARLRQLEQSIRTGAAHRIAASVELFTEGSPS